MPGAELLFAEHQQSVFRYLSKVVGQSDAARDLTQEVFLRVARTAVPDETDDDGRRAWVFRIARNLALNHLRDRGRQPAVVPLIETAQPATQELKVSLDRAIASLPDLDRDVFLLRESVGLSYSEVAAACEVTVEAVRARLHRARQRLREELTRPLADVTGVQIGRREGREAHDRNHAHSRPRSR